MTGSGPAQGCLERSVPLWKPHFGGTLSGGALRPAAMLSLAVVVRATAVHNTYQSRWEQLLATTQHSRPFCGMLPPPRNPVGWWGSSIAGPPPS